MRTEDLLSAATEWSVIASEANDVAMASKAAAAGYQHYITGYSVSASGAVTPAATVQLLDGVTVIDQFELPASATAPIVRNWNRPFRITAGAKADLVLPALGSGITGTAVLYGFTRPA